MATKGQIESESVVKGLWRNQDLPAWKGNQFLVEDQTAQMISNAMAIALALVLRRLVVFAKVILPYLVKGCSKSYIFLTGLYSQARRSVGRELRSHDPISSSVAPDVILLEPPRARIAAGAAQTFAESSSFEEAASRIIRHHLAMDRVELTENDHNSRSFGHSRNALRNLREDFWAFTWLSAIALLLFALFVGQQAIAISAASIITGSEALISSPICGVWLSELYSDQKIVTGDNNLSMPLTSFAADRSQRAISYVDTCYANNSRLGECSYYYTSKIPFRESHNTSCPFGGDTCLYGKRGAYSLDSGFLDSSLLGINERHRCKFRLQLTCAPLGDRYVESRPGERNGSVVVDYYFGNVQKTPGRHENLTFSWTFQEPNFNSVLFGKKGYQWSEYPFTGPGRPYSNFRAELLNPNATTTLIFVSSQAVFFLGPSTDPIFSAVRAPASTGYSGLYWNTLQRHTVLACAETVSLQHPRSGALFYPSLSPPSLLKEPEWQNPSVVSSVVLLNLSLHIPDYFPNKYSWKTSSFDVNKKNAAIFASTPLEPDQWKVEAKRMFEIRAARWQMDILGTASGIGWDLPLARNVLQDYSGKVEWNGTLDLGVDVDVCRRIKFQANGWKNISLTGLLMFLFLSGFIWVSTIKLGEEKEVLLVWAINEFLVPVMRRIRMFPMKLWLPQWDWKLSLVSGRRFSYGHRRDANELTVNASVEGSANS